MTLLPPERDSLAEAELVDLFWVLFVCVFVCGDVVDDLSACVYRSIIPIYSSG